MGKAKKIILIAIIAIGILLLATNIKGVGDHEYSIQTLNELCQKEEEIFSGRLAQDYYDAARNWELAEDSTLVQLSELQFEYTHSIRERYDINPVLFSDINARLQVGQLNCE